MKGIIYKVIDNTTNEVIYVGSTKQKYFSMRVGDHRKPSNKRHMYFYDYVNENGGWSNFIFVPIEEIEFVKDEERFQKEREAIELLSPLCNVALPYKTDEEKRILKNENNKHFRDNHPNYHHRYRETESYKLSVKARCETIITCECGGTYHLQNKSNHMKSKYHNEFVMSGKAKEQTKIECLKCGSLIKTYDTINEIYDDLGLSTTAVCNNLKGRSKTCGGYTFRYVTI